MKDYLLLMHDDAARPVLADAWAPYLETLRASGVFQGGSAIGAGEALQKGRAPKTAGLSVTGYIRIIARDLDEARRWVPGNPVFESGGTVELRELPRT